MYYNCDLNNLSIFTKYKFVYKLLYVIILGNIYQLLGVILWLTLIKQK